MRPARPSPFTRDLTGQLARFRVVLVEPKYDGNVGQVARAMATAGFGDLRLVRARCALGDDAVRWSMGGRPVLEAARRHDTLAEAVEGVRHVLVTTRFGGRHRPNPLRPRAAARLALALPAEEPVAIVFGAEDRGLSREDADHAWSFVSIPTGGTPSLNLGQAVAVVLHAFTDVAMDRREEGALGAPEQARAAARLLELLHRVGFLAPGDAPRMEPKLLATFDRFDLDARELKILHGIIGQIERALDGDGTTAGGAR